jgi:hypothetical protein
VLLDAQVEFGIQQTTQHMARVAHADVDHLGVERRVLFADVGVEQPSRLAAVTSRSM